MCMLILFHLPVPSEPCSDRFEVGILEGMSERFFFPGSLVPGPFELEGAEAHHLTHVCRLKPGESLTLFNGDGRDYPARLLSSSKRSATVEVLEPVPISRELPWLVEIAAPLPKGDRAIFLIEKLTELGVRRFVPLECQRTVVHPREGKLDKLERHVIEACKQCERNVLLEIESPTPWSQYVLPRGDEYRGLAHPRSREDYQQTSLANLIITREARTVRLVVGPEGGFTEHELGLARTHGWTLLDLGPRILRLETAALTLAAWASQLA